MESIKSKKKFNLNPDNIYELQKSLYEWQNYNFGSDQDVQRALMGMCEEAGELCHAQLKLEQGIRGNPDELNAAARDAVGDIGIYMLNYLSGLGLVVPSVDSAFTHDISGDISDIRNAVFGVFIATARVAAARHNPSDVEPRIKNLIEYLNKVCHLKGWSLTSVLMDTWAAVGLRDWVTYPKNGISN